MGRIIGWISPTQRSSSFFRCFCDVFLTKSRLDQFTWCLRVIFAWRTCCCKKARIVVISQIFAETTNRCWRWLWRGQGLEAYIRPCVERGNLCGMSITVERETSLPEVEKTFELLLCHFEIRWPGLWEIGPRSTVFLSGNLCARTAWTLGLMHYEVGVRVCRPTLVSSSGRIVLGGRSSGSYPLHLHLPIGG